MEFFLTLPNPLCMMIVLSLVFSNIFKFRVENFPLYLLSGQIIFNFFSRCDDKCNVGRANNSALIKKVYMPKYLFVIFKVFSSFINLLASFTALLVVMIATRAELHWKVVFAVIPLGFIVVFSLGVGLLLSALVVKFRDIMHLYSVFITALLYLTPVIYPMSSLPYWMQKVVGLNPITNILMMFRDVMLYDNFPNLSSILIATIESLTALGIGVYVFYKKQDEFILNI